MSQAGDRLDVITFSGNGEPTLHPCFEDIINDTIEVRDRYYPSAKVSGCATQRASTVPM